MSRQIAESVTLSAACTLAGLLIALACGGSQHRIAEPAKSDRALFAAHSAKGREHLRFGRATDAEKELLAALETTRGLRSSDVRSQTALGNLENVADLYREQGQHDRYIGLVEVLLVETQRIRGPDSPSLVALQRGLADAHAARLEVDEAEAAYRRAIEAMSANRGADDPAVAETRVALARLYLDTERPEPAVEELEKATSALEASGHGEEPAMASALVVEGVALTELGRFEDAEPVLLRAQDITEATYGENALSGVQMMGALGRLYAKQGRDDEADAMLTRALETQAAATRNRPQMLPPLLDMAAFYTETDRPQVARGLADRGIEILEKRKVGGLLLAQAIAAKADALASEGKAKEAEGLYADAAAEAESDLPASRRELVSILERRAAVLREFGRDEDAAAVDARRDALASPTGRDASTEADSGSETSEVPDGAPDETSSKP